MQKPPHKSSGKIHKKKSIHDPAHPFHSFAKKESGQPSSSKKKSFGRTDFKEDLFESRGRKKGYAAKLQHSSKLKQHDAPLQQALFDKNEIFPLNKYLSHTGLCSRRKAVDYIKTGEVSVNGKTITEPGFKVTQKDLILLQGKKLFLEVEPVYILLNKPKGYITTTNDPKDRKTVMELISHATTERVYPVGRLDRNTSGLLLLTNDGDLAQHLAHPSNEIKKLYHVTLDKPLTKHHFENILKGIELEDGLAKADVLAYEEEGDKTQIGIEIHSGKNRVVRRIFEHLNYEVKALDRVLYAGLTKKNLPRGKWRRLSPKEVILLKHFNKKK
ncbi:MAG: rRNA pseudouridine synthase [Chitinophagaceae bacterium]|nr:MAG: rRNA pseudouridine synthase [Chitinophagaceae bacterium]